MSQACFTTPLSRIQRTHCFRLVRGYADDAAFEAHVSPPVQVFAEARELGDGFSVEVYGTQAECKARESFGLPLKMFETKLVTAEA